MVFLCKQDRHRFTMSVINCALKCTMSGTCARKIHMSASFMAQKYFYDPRANGFSMQTGQTSVYDVGHKLCTKMHDVGYKLPFKILPFSSSLRFENMFTSRKAMYFVWKTDGLLDSKSAVNLDWNEHDVIDISTLVAVFRPKTCSAFQETSFLFHSIRWKMGNLYSSRNNSPLRPNVDYHFEADRLNSFERHHWPFCAEIHPTHMARAGFFYTGVGDAVKCPWCGIVINNWKRINIPFVEHRHFSPQCQFVAEYYNGNHPIQ